MNLELAGVAERVVQDFPELPVCTVIDALCECADACDSAGPFFIEQAVRAKLAGLDHEQQPAPAPVVIPAQVRTEMPATQLEAEATAATS